MEATHTLERQGQASSAGSKSSSPQKSLTFWRGKERHIISRVQIQLITEATHQLETRTGIVSRLQIQLTTHFLESQGQTSSAGSKSSSPWRPLTSWRGEDRHHQQGPNPAHHTSHSLPGEPRTSTISSRVHIQHKVLAIPGCPAHHRSHSPTGEARTGVLSRVQIQLTMQATHFLESQGQVSSAGPKFSLVPQSLTF